jgi:molybdopterin-containing oxidoreductase family membrane subunit
MYFVRTNYKLDKYLTHHHFDMMGKLLVLVSIVYLYFNINEFLVPAFKMKSADAIHIRELFVGEYATLFWSVQLLGLIIPIVLLLFKFFRRPFSMLIISIVVLVAAWFKRYLIVVPAQDHPFLPKQFVPDAWMVYHPTVVETAITVGTLLLVIIIITLLVKLFPVIPIWEMAEEQTGNVENPQE